MSAVISAPQPLPRFHVRVWFGEHVIAQYSAEEALADRYAAAMRRRFACLKVTTDPIVAAPADPPVTRS
ncbi:hypothetical protein JOF29_004408 [Kribbella aluminosa]|uniref:Uncharacterized protein n=1 Tax=Kribbella aluminosa TaxID=416017 RepID=A0ABS4UNS6_9ACTN|nr:hypothetical protein [Kribbella aluminosa]MBP2353298.1 hypothetical protein [Kribbella aluminosa]